jgi:hypothetical protein
MAGSGTTNADELVQLFAWLVGVEVEQGDRDCLESVGGALQRIRGFVAATDVRVERRAAALADEARRKNSGGGGGGGNDDDAGGGGGGGGGGPEPPPPGGRKSRRSEREKERDRKRAGAGSAMPLFEAALREGRIDVAHVDAVVDALARLTQWPEAQQKFLGYESMLLAVAEIRPADKFRRRCTDLARQLARDHGEAQLERQRADSEMRRWVDRHGMHHVHLTLDPERGAIVDTAIQQRLDALRSSPETADLSWPAVNVQAMLDLLTSAGRLDPRQPEIIVIIDHDTLVNGVFGAGSVCETSTGVPLPPATVRRMACDAGILPAVLNGDGLVLDLGDRQRLASRAQRNALRAMYRTCAFSDCQVPFDRCRIHHWRPWFPHRRTNLEDLVPVCGKHHHQLHEGGWHLELEADRTGRLTTADGVIEWEGHTCDRLPGDDASFVEAGRTYGSAA